MNTLLTVAGILARKVNFYKLVIKKGKLHSTTNMFQERKKCPYAMSGFQMILSHPLCVWLSVCVWGGGSSFLFERVLHSQTRFFSILSSFSPGFLIHVLIYWMSEWTTNKGCLWMLLGRLFECTEFFVKIDKQLHILSPGSVTLMLGCAACSLN